MEISGRLRGHPEVGDGLLPADDRETVEEVVQAIAGREVLDEYLDGDTGAGEDELALITSGFLEIAFSFPACGMVRTPSFAPVVPAPLYLMPEVPTAMAVLGGRFVFLDTPSWRLPDSCYALLCGE